MGASNSLIREKVRQLLYEIPHLSDQKRASLEEIISEMDLSLLKDLYTILQSENRNFHRVLIAEWNAAEAEGDLFEIDHIMTKSILQVSQEIELDSHKKELSQLDNLLGTLE